MWMTNKQKRIVLWAFTIGIASSGWFTAQAKPAIKVNACTKQASDQVVFHSGESLFTVLAWLNWVADRETEIDLSHYDPVQAHLQKLVARLPRALYEKHRKAYLGYLSGSPPYVKNGLLISDSLYYGDAPSFALQTTKKNPDVQEAYRLAQLPPASLLAEFYQVLELKKHWEQTYAPVFLSEEQKYKASILNGFTKAHCFLKVSRTAPLDVIVNPLDSFGTAGQTSYNAVKKRFLIKLHVDQHYTTQQNIEQIAAHEYTHALMNNHLAPYEKAFAKKMKIVGEAVGQDFDMPLQELFAQSVSHLETAGNDAKYTDSISYYTKNLLLPHLLAKVPGYEVQNKPFTAFSPDLMETFDTQLAIAHWHRFEQEQGPLHRADTSLSPQEAEIVAMAIKHASLLQPKLVTFQKQVSQKLLSLQPQALIQNAFENRAHLSEMAIIRENVFYIYKNPLYLHFSEQLPTLKPGDSVEQWVKELFTSFSVDKEVLRWRSVEQRFAEEDAAEDQ